MSEYIEIKSKVLSVFDFHGADISQFIPEYEIDEKQLENDMNRVLRAHGKKVSAEEVSVGDQAELSCVSENQKFNKGKVFVMVGKGLYSRELEEKIVGMKKGEEKEITVGEDTVKVCVRNVTHTELPDMTDENIASFGIDGVSNVSDFRRHCVDKQITRFLDEDECADMASAQLAQSVLNDSEFELDDEELEAVKNMAENRINSFLSDKNISDDNDVLEDTEMTVGEYKAFMENILVSELKAAAISYQTLKEKNELIKTEDYKALIKNHSAAAGVSTEEGEKQYPMRDYARESYAEIYLKSIDDYVAEIIKRAINP